MYTYTAGATGLDAAMPLWVQAGGREAWIARLRDPAIRARVAEEMRRPGAGLGESVLRRRAAKGCCSPISAIRRCAAMPARRLAEVARERGTSPEETAMDLVVEDGSRVGTIYFLMSEDNVRRQVQLPWMSFGSDAGSIATEGVFLNAHPHPRAYGNFARLLGRYVRDERLVPLQEAVRRLTSLPAANLGIRERGALRAGLSCRSRHLRSGDDRRPRHLRGAARLCGRHAPRLRQRRPGAAPTASRPAPRPGGWCAARAGTAARPRPDKSLTCHGPPLRRSRCTDGGVGSERTLA